MKAIPIVGIPQWDQQVQQGILKVIIDFAPLPKTKKFKKETADQLEALQDESKAKLINVLNSIQSKM